MGRLLPKANETKKALERGKPGKTRVCLGVRESKNIPIWFANKLMIYSEPHSTSSSSIGSVSENLGARNNKGRFCDTNTLATLSHAKAIYSILAIFAGTLIPRTSHRVTNLRCVRGVWSPLYERGVIRTGPK